jgi:DNA-binding NtrC family response regulator
MMAKKIGKILIAEDDTLLAKSLKIFLEQNNLNVINILPSGEDLISEAVSSTPSLIISDITLQGEIDGIEAVSRINRIRDIPYIFMTGHSEYLPLIKSYNLKPIKVFIKPVDFNLLFDTIEEYYYGLTKETYSYYYLG